MLRMNFLTPFNPARTATAATVAAVASPVTALASSVLSQVPHPAIAPFNWTPCKAMSVSSKDFEKLPPDVRWRVIEFKARSLIAEGTAAQLRRFLEKAGPLDESLFAPIMSCVRLGGSKERFRRIVSVVEALSPDSKARLVWKEISHRLIPEGCDVVTIAQLLSCLEKTEENKEQGGYALKRAIELKNPDSVRCLLEFGVNPNEKFSVCTDYEQYDRMSALEYGVFLGYPPVVKAFIKSGKVSSENVLYAKKPLIDTAVPIPLQLEEFKGPMERVSRINLDEMFPHSTDGVTFTPYNFRGREEIVLALLEEGGVETLGGDEAIRNRVSWCNMQRVLKRLDELKQDSEARLK